MKKLKLQLLLIFLFALPITVQAQNSTLYSQYLDNPVFSNIGFTAYNNRAQIATQYRNFTLANGGLVHSSSLSYIQPLFLNTDLRAGSDQKFGAFSLAINNHTAGIFNNTSFQGGFTYNLPLAENKILGMGLQANFMHKSLNQSNITTSSQLDPNGAYDPNLDIGENFNSDASMSYMLNLGFSLQSYGEDDELMYQVGISVYNLGQSTSDLINETPETPIAYIISADILAYHQGLWDIRPNTRIIHENGINTIDIGANFRYYIFSKDSPFRNTERSSTDFQAKRAREDGWYFSTGIAYRTTGAAVLSASLQRENLLIGASFDMPFQQTGEQLGANNALELLLAYQFGKK